MLSDMCHETLGVPAADTARSLGLAACAAELALGAGVWDSRSDCGEPPHECGGAEALRDGAGAALSPWTRV